VPKSTKPAPTPTPAPITNLVWTGTAGADYFTGGAGNDRLSAGGGNDFVDGGAGNDIIDGGSGDDRLFGGLGDDTLIGGIGNDYLDGSFGRNILTGGAGADVFFLGTSGAGNVSTITDFSRAQGDVLLINLFGTAQDETTGPQTVAEALSGGYLSLTDSANGVVVSVDTDGAFGLDTLQPAFVLTGVTLATLGGDAVIFG
jgi:Ca2+-binding RTX toxin-like protein